MVLNGELGRITYPPSYVMYDCSGSVSNGCLLKMVHLREGRILLNLYVL